jgi:hypothetical protein
LGIFSWSVATGIGRAHAGDHVLALRVDEVFAVKDLFAGGRIAGEGDAGAAFVAGVAEDHRLDVDRGAPLVRDVVFLAVNDGALVVPRAEDGPDGAAQLLVRIAREIAPVRSRTSFLKRETSSRSEEASSSVSETSLRPGKISFFRRRSPTSNGSWCSPGRVLHAHDDVAVHLDEAAVAVVGEALVGAGRR